MLIQNTGSNATPQPVATNDAPVIQPAPAIQPAIQTAPVIQTAIQTAPVIQPAIQTTPTTAQLQRAIQNTNQAMQDSGKSLTFSIDEATKETVVKLMDTQTNQVIGQFPSKQMLAISEAIGLMQEQLQQAAISKATVQTAPGLLIKQTA